MSKLSAKKQGSLIGSMLMARGVRSADEVVKTTEPCHCMPPHVLHLMNARKENICARAGCTNSTVRGGVAAVRVFRKAALCKIVHSVETAYCCTYCKDIDFVMDKMLNPNLQTADFTK